MDQEKKELKGKDSNNAIGVDKEKLAQKAKMVMKVMEDRKRKVEDSGDSDSSGPKDGTGPKSDSSSSKTETSSENGSETGSETGDEGSNEQDLIDLNDKGQQNNKQLSIEKRLQPQPHPSAMEEEEGLEEEEIEEEEEEEEEEGSREDDFTDEEEVTTVEDTILPSGSGRHNEPDFDDDEQVEEEEEGEDIPEDEKVQEEEDILDDGEIQGEDVQEEEDIVDEGEIQGEDVQEEEDILDEGEIQGEDVQDEEDIQEEEEAQGEEVEEEESQEEGEEEGEEDATDEETDSVENTILPGVQSSLAILNLAAIDEDDEDLLSDNESEVNEEDQVESEEEEALAQVVPQTKTVSGRRLLPPPRPPLIGVNKSISSNRPPSRPTYIAMIVDCLKNFDSKGGSSLAFIKKYLAKMFDIDFESSRVTTNSLHRAIKQALDQEIMVIVAGKGMSGSFRLVTSKTLKLLRKEDSRTNEPTATGSKVTKAKGNAKTKSVAPPPVQPKLGPKRKLRNIPGSPIPAKYQRTNNRKAKVIPEPVGRGRANKRILPPSPPPSKPSRNKKEPVVPPQPTIVQKIISKPPLPIKQLRKQEKENRLEASTSTSSARPPKKGHSSKVTVSSPEPAKSKKASSVPPLPTGSKSQSKTSKVLGEKQAKVETKITTAPLPISSKAPKKAKVDPKVVKGKVPPPEPERRVTRSGAVASVSVTAKSRPAAAVPESKPKALKGRR